MDENQEPQVINLMDALKASLRVGEEIRTMSPSAQAAVRREALRSPAVTALLEAVANALKEQRIDGPFYEALEAACEALQRERRE